MPKKTLTGQIVSNKMQQTVVVAVNMPKKHPLYKKSIKNTRRFKAKNTIGAELNDKVIIQECTPFSKEGVWEIIEVLK